MTMTIAIPLFPPAADGLRASIPAGLARQERRRQTALARLAKLRATARAEIDRLIAFLDASDGYVMNELEAEEAEPSLASLDCRIDQTNWAGGGSADLEDEEDGREPGDDEEPSLGAFEGHQDQDVAWTTDALGAYLDKELDPSESGIGDHAGLLEQVGSQDWTQTVMA
ncbi:hypothetical protein IVB02_21410 [Bradyrhizobium sp. 166]|uniref:hypothetical protein n=1 Tax=Bradyrhizobium sp. 166 TaxID=2782638 RepID=UPI001FF9AE4C|nr:hypothetical protein [Bradyrhizobium sp. 166]MCK1603925.1 hypothetical protein [Bradyrhizobium sp. 166]